MPTRLLLFFLSVLLLGAVGCSKQHGASSSPAADAALRSVLQGPLRDLEGGRTREAIGGLLGQPVDATAWTRAERTMAHRQSRPQSDEEQCAENLRKLSDAVELFRADEANGYHLPQKLGELVAAKQIDAIPTCPSASRDTYSAGYRPDSRNEFYAIVCKGRNHAAAGLRADSPRYDPRFGVVFEGETRVAWWPAKYHADVEAADVSGDRATVTIRESGGKRATLRLTMKRVEAGGKTSWVVDTEKYADDGGSALGLLLGTYLAALSSPAPVATVDRSQCERSLQRVATALEGWSSDHAGRYPAKLDALVPKYLPSIPACSGDAPPSYRTTTDGSSYDLGCAGAHPEIHITNRTSGQRLSRNPG